MDNLTVDVNTPCEYCSRSCVCKYNQEFEKAQEHINNCINDNLMHKGTFLSGGKAIFFNISMKCLFYKKEDTTPKDAMQKCI